MIGQKPRVDVTGGAAGKTGGGIDCHIEIIGTPIAFTPISGISGMKAERFTAGSLWIERTRRREGPQLFTSVLCGFTSNLQTVYRSKSSFAQVG